MGVANSTYLIALGSNRAGRHGGPRAQLHRALAALGEVRAVAPVIESAPIGPSIRRFANSVCLLESDAEPDALLQRLKAIERGFGRCGGRRWGARVIDLDIILWSGGPWSSTGLTIPHPAFRQRAFVLGPAVAIARGWRDPITGLTLSQLHARLTRARRTPR